MEIIIRGHSRGGNAEQRRLKGKSVTEFAKNLESEGWPSEFRSEDERSRVKFVEKKLGRALEKDEIKRINLSKI
jgi:hypothetical protein